MRLANAAIGLRDTLKQDVQTLTLLIRSHDLGTWDNNVELKIPAKSSTSAAGASPNNDDIRTTLGLLSCSPHRFAAFSAMQVMMLLQMRSCS
eukprot:CAMPEP_0172775902 /NCGR_PEP_ID=MMETSP1074-20121228/198864_1 /TAXON_ID=2916 /ORGANISM="Ceratium fusus, Strain PA161109" /LENGTH=91 /DNA_ID=CAMNT_0013612587 /DNA_START=203 /DNA_END=479 /DNA_ORIENTATION=-